MAEDRATRLKRLTMRSSRRGTREMDLILIAFSRVALPGMGEADLDLYEALLAENDQDLYAWIVGPDGAPDRYDRLLKEIRRSAYAAVAG